MRSYFELPSRIGFALLGSPLGASCRTGGPGFTAPGVRRRLFTALAWVGAGYTVIAVLAPALAELSYRLVAGLEQLSASLCAVAGVAGFVAVLCIGNRLDRRNRTGAQVLLWSTVISYTVFINLAFAGFDSGARSTIEHVPPAVVNVGGSALASLLIAVAVRSVVLRVCVFVLVVLGPFLVLAPELWWFGLLCAVLLVVAVEVALHHALKLAYIPEPALAACLIAGFVVLPLAVFYVLVRFLLRAAMLLLPLPESRA